MRREGPGGGESFPPPDDMLIGFVLRYLAYDQDSIGVCREVCAGRLLICPCRVWLGLVWKGGTDGSQVQLLKRFDDPIPLQSRGHCSKRQRDAAAQLDLR